MTSTLILNLCFLAWLLTAGIGEAQPFEYWSPKKLESKASLVCNGTVLSIEDTGTRDKRGLQNWMGKIVMSAKIRVLHVLKGEAPAEIEFRYCVLAPEDYIPIIADNHVSLITGKRYRLFLKPEVLTNRYVNVLDGTSGEDQSVEELWPKESNDSPPLPEEDVVKIAREYALKNLHVKIDLLNPDTFCFPGGNGEGVEWSVLFSTGINRSFRVVVRNDREIDLKQTNLDNH